MDYEVIEMLDEELKAELSDIASMNTGSKEKSDAVKDLAELYKLRIEDAKAAADSEDKRNRLAGEVKDRYIKLGTAAAELVLPLMFYSVWMCMGFKFEKDGTFTSTTFRGLFSHFRPTKK